MPISGCAICMSDILKYFSLGLASISKAALRCELRGAEAPIYYIRTIARLGSGFT